MKKVKQTIITTLTILLSAWILYGQLNASSQPHEAVEKAAKKEGIHLNETAITHLEDNHAYTLYYTDDSYGFALTEKNMFGWKVVNFIEGLPLTEALANYGYSFSNGVMHGIVTSFVSGVQIGEQGSNIQNVPGQNLRVWYNVNVTPEDAKSIKFISKNGLEF
ncbi:hypothetical protein [Piscibacillus salipiscarius]|uniref:DUF4309 domain-containing protein n=1 Tax=Piscibacillus salipiscarius TaxID=299480 RepID=A0ABW5QAJ1_9BACI|nr:hypothetical protein [Piscibacillus salipiscarius]